CLREVEVLDVHRQHRRAAPGQLEAVEAGVAAHVQHAPAAQVVGEVGRDLQPLEAREIAADEVVGRGLHAAGQVQVVEPGTEGVDLALQVVGAGGGLGRRGCVHRDASSSPSTA